MEESPYTRPNQFDFEQVLGTVSKKEQDAKVKDIAKTCFTDYKEKPAYVSDLAERKNNVIQAVTIAAGAMEDLRSYFEMDELKLRIKIYDDEFDDERIMSELPDNDDVLYIIDKHVLSIADVLGDKEDNEEANASIKTLRMDIAKTFAHRNGIPKDKRNIFAREYAEFRAGNASGLISEEA